MKAFNHFAVWVAAIAQFLLGAVWYTVFAQPWLDGIGKTPEQIEAAHGGSPLPYVIGLAAAVIIAYTLAQLIGRLGKHTAANGARIGAALGVTLIGATLAMNYGFEARSVTLWLLNTGYMTVGMALMGAIVGGWKRKFNP